MKTDYPYIAEVQLPKGYENAYPFENGDRVVVLGEITNMPGHVIIVTRMNEIHWGYHKEEFRKLTQEET